jgi:hypothetical protein
MMPRARLLDWKPLAKGTLLGFAKVQFSSGLIISEIGIHRSGDRVWANPPARPWIDHDALVRDERGRVKYQPLIGFANHGVHASWSRQVIRAVREQHPAVLGDLID